jgi:hypothetical protein
MLYRLINILLILIIFSPFTNAFDTLKVEAQLDTLRKTITGTVTYKIPPKPNISSFEFQMYANLYSSEDTPYLRKKRNLKSILAQSGKWGGMTIDSIFVDNKNLTDKLDIDLTEGKIEINDSAGINGKTVKLFFKTRIPERADRLSYNQNEYLLDCWFPVPGILKPDGTWYIPEYNHFSEPVGDFHNFDIQLTLPENMIVAAPTSSKKTGYNDTLVTHSFTFGPAHGFALAVSPDYLIDTVELNTTTLLIYYHDYEITILSELKNAVISSFEFMTEYVGEYDYDYFTIAITNTSFSGGIEFPAIVSMSSPRGTVMITNFYIIVVIHEVVHQWFYGMIGSDQARNPWLDEAITSFFTLKIVEEYYGTDANLFDFANLKMSERDFLRSYPLLSSNLNRLTDPTGSFYTSGDYFGTIYYKGALLVETFDNLLGDSLSSVFWRNYFKKYKFKHPYSNDFIETVREICGTELENVAFHLFNNYDEYDYSVSRISNSREDSATIKSEITFIKTGGLSYPVSYRVFLYNGDSLDFVWDSTMPIEEISHIFASPAVKVIIDPENLYAVDPNLLNNSFTVEADSRPALRLSSGLMFLLESILSLLGGL